MMVPKEMVRIPKEPEYKMIFGRVAREEICHIKMKVDNVIELEKQLRVLTNLPDLRETDTVNIDYKFIITYFGDIVKNLQAIKEICEYSDVVIDVDCELLEQGECVVYEVLDKLRKVIKIIKRRKHKALMSELGMLNSEVFDSEAPDSKVSNPDPEFDEYDYLDLKRSDLTSRDDTLYRWDGGLSYTDGVRYMAEHGAAYWLIKSIATAQEGNNFDQVWELTVTKSGKATLLMRKGVVKSPLCADEYTIIGTGGTLITRSINYTNFPLSRIRLLVVNGKLMLPCEYPN